jgi:hypothetical protein
VRIPVTLLDRNTGKDVEGELFDDVTVKHFVETQGSWRPMVIAARDAMRAAGSSLELIPRHWHWDWNSKEAELDVLAFSFYGIECRAKLQGLMKLQTAGRSSRLAVPGNQPIVYIDYLEVAPWNIPIVAQATGQKTEFGAVGTRLIEAAVRKSFDEGFKGRVALHSLSTSEGFYINVCGMTAVSRDPDKQNLLWCEFTPEQANNFLA